MKKLLILTNTVPEYRVPIYNMLAQIFDLTVAHFENSSSSCSISFKKHKLTKKKIGPFIFVSENIHRIAKGFDAVIAMGDLHVFSYMFLGFKFRRSYSLTYWGGDVSFSYKKGYDVDRRFDMVRFYLMNKADSIIFYSKYPVHRYINDGGINPEKLFVSNNTVHIAERINIPVSKKYFLFVGTLYKEKKIFELLESYYKATNLLNDIHPLIIVGDGSEKETIEVWIKEHELSEKIILKGAIYDEILLRNIFQDAIACISPGQAGLSVLSSMAYGVPFITTKNAITGGEIFNISHDQNGLLYENGENELTQIILTLAKNEAKVAELSINAQEYYYQNATSEMMVENLKLSVEYAIKLRNNF